MNYKKILQHGLALILYVGIQVVLFKDLGFFDKAFSFIYIGLFLFLPIEIDRLLLLGLGFFTGIFIDMFYDSLGVHAGASVLVCFFRPGWINLITPQGGYDEGAAPSLSQLGGGWFLRYMIPLILIHHLAIFYIEAGGFSLFFFTLVKVLASTLFTFLVLLLVQLLFYRR